jgi:hypothetical protein
MRGRSPPGVKRAALVLPAVLLTVNLVETLAAYEVHRRVRDVHLRVALAIVLYGAGFAVAADWLTPILKRAITETHRDTRRHGGAMGALVFYAVAYGGLYYAYWQLEMHGPAAFLPPGWR